MRPDLVSYLLVAGVGAAVTLVSVPLFDRLSRRRGLMVEPDARRFHDRPTGSLGGGAMYLGFVVAFLAARFSGSFDATFDGSTEPWAILACATMAYGVGLLDDLRELSPPAKIAGMVLAAGLLAAGGVSIIWFRIPFLDVFVLPYDLAFVATVVWVLGMANAVNFIDGLDGLAAGIVGIGATAFLLYGIRLGQVELLLPGNVGPLVAALVLGVCTGFLPWNVYPARIFMGDGGSLLLGSLMAASTMAVGGRTPDPFSGQTFFFYAPLAIPLVILGVPVLDTAFAILRRAKGGKGLATADKDHLHHRLVRLGHGHRRSVWILWAWTALLSAFVLYPTYNEGQGDAIVPMGVGAAALVLFTLFQPGTANRRTDAGAATGRAAPDAAEVPGDNGDVSIDVTPPIPVPEPSPPQAEVAAERSAGPVSQPASGADRTRFERPAKVPDRGLR
ncbi:MAG: undecaprenyl/decaprenyl-phosphate alpha-N-acetylglucosaminyl 1-phosphate transferase [Acidimicrobiia bacterium]|nr:undecaprenyl/decaprenyl-phosphate alpha-N-acetylglucosaminyl 1-phosphate transferase [Acidimicrobiia bacterium]